MATVEETLSFIRDATHINQHALALIHEEARETFATVRLWPDSDLKKSILSDLASVITSYDRAQQLSVGLRDKAQQALQTMSADPVPPPPDYPDIETAGGVAQWSQRDW